VVAEGARDEDEAVGVQEVLGNHALLNTDFVKHRKVIEARLRLAPRKDGDSSAQGNARATPKGTPARAATDASRPRREEADQK
jgi:hypothetical protein